MEQVLFHYPKFAAYRTNMEAVANIPLLAENIVNSIKVRKAMEEAIKNILGLLPQEEFKRKKDRERLNHHHE